MAPEFILYVFFSYSEFFGVMLDFENFLIFCVGVCFF
jgi:hypothetical protein